MDLTEDTISTHTQILDNSIILPLQDEQTEIDHDMTQYLVTLATSELQRLGEDVVDQFSTRLTEANLAPLGEKRVREDDMVSVLSDDSLAPPLPLPPLRLKRSVRRRIRVRSTDSPLRLIWMTIYQYRPRRNLPIHCRHLGELELRALEAHAALKGPIRYEKGIGFLQTLVMGSLGTKQWIAPVLKLQRNFENLKQKNAMLTELQHYFDVCVSYLSTLTLM